MNKAKQNLRVQLWVTVASVLIFAIKIVAYYTTHSLAILTDAMESIVNVLAGFIGLFSLYIASKPRDIDHPYGHGKAEFVSAAAEGALIMAAGLFVVYETVFTILNKNNVEKLDNGLWLIGATGIVNYFLGIFCIHIGNKNDSLALKVSGKHLQIDTFSTLAVIVGLLLIVFTKMLWIDKLIAAILSIIILYNGYKIIRSSLAGIMDEADIQLLNRFVAVLNKDRHKNWVDLHNFRIIKYGSQLHIDCHLTVPWYINVHEAHKEIDVLNRIILQTFGNSIELFVHTDGCLPFSCAICIKDDCSLRMHPLQGKIEWSLSNILANKRHNSSLLTLGKG